MNRSRHLPRALTVVGLLATACGGSQAEAQPTQAPTPAKAEPSRVQVDPDAGRDPATQVAGATVYDAKGESKACEPPRTDCAPARPNRDFLDQCRLKGFQVRRCGCEDVCSGKLEGKRTHYDAKGQAHDCAPPDPGCAPPENSAAFQDACNDAGHHLVTCGCAWLCDGPPKR